MPPESPESYMNDAAFKAKLAEARKAQTKLVRDRNDIAEKMKAKIEALKKKLNTDDLKKVQAELEKDAEWAALYAACTNANEKCKASRQALLNTVRARIAPRKPQSKPISK